jgi:hypothetical protein
VTARASLEELAEPRGAQHRDCRVCRHFDPQGDALQYGWCGAHSQFVKMASVRRDISAQLTPFVGGREVGCRFRSVRSSSG